MKKFIKSKSFVFRAILVLALAMTLFLFQSSTIQAEAAPPRVNVINVVTDANITVEMVNFPKNTAFTVRMGKQGTGGIGGDYSAGFSTLDSTYHVANFEIPTRLYGEGIIDVRITSEDGKYVATSWFYNTYTAPEYKPPVTEGSGTGYYGIPTTSINSVEYGVSVTLTTYNFPADKTFVVTMGEFGKRGIGGIEVDEFNSAGGGSFQLTFDIPEELADEDRIAIRLQTPDGVFYAFDWFNNKPYSPSGETTETSTDTDTGSAAINPNAGYSGYPTTTILEVVPGESVEVQVYNLPKQIDFVVTMGQIGTRGVGGVKVAEFNSEDGGNQVHTFDIPEALKDYNKIAIRIDSGVYYAFDWFINQVLEEAAADSSETTTETRLPDNFPSSSFVSVDPGGMVTFMVYNFPKDTDFNVYMGKYGTRGVNGIYVQTFNSGAGGSFTVISEIPTALKDEALLAIRYEGGGIYLFDWFSNK